MSATLRMDSGRLPIGVVIPTLNCVGPIVDHVRQVQSWIDLVEQVIVVDSFSEDGTYEYLQTHLKHPRCRVLQHPRGLYQSWNFGIDQVEAPYTYVSTVGDLIDAEGLGYLLSASQRLEVDVVVSPPVFYDLAGQTIPDARPWPVHRLLAACPLAEPRRLEHWQALLLATLSIPEGLMGSSASNLYRTATLKKFPFPAEFHTAGDTAWGLAQAMQTSIGLAPRVCARFVIHENGNTNMQAEAFHQLMSRLYALALGCWDHLGGADQADPRLRRLSASIRELITSRGDLTTHSADYHRRKHQFPVWVLNPSAWRARTARNRTRQRVRTASQDLKKIFADLASDPRTDASDRSLLQYVATLV